MRIQLHAYEPVSRANGPGLRCVIWVQGCNLGCPGCFNPGTHDSGDGKESDTEELSGRILANLGSVEGLSISGGEPFQQPEALLDLLRRLEGSKLSILIFSGYTRLEIEDQPFGQEILSRCDVLVAGRYRQSKHCGSGLLGSTNQTINLLTALYNPTDFERVPRSEIIIHRDGTFTLTGIQSLRLNPQVLGELHSSNHDYVHNNI